ncbi:hypothetical protein PRVXH_000778 [Proteinivorax hydrogeniformans]|uniref:Lipoprotein n=1 Tax=Proteinivorax hydrogeniformans TaxID=1826727 RepID=A0AAU8HVR7_9FIRM
MKRFFLGIFVVLFTVNSIGCSSGTTTQKSSVSIDDETKDISEALSIDIDRTLQELALCFDVRISQGDLSWQVLSPQGQVVKEGKVESGESYRERLYFAPRQGRWIVEVDGKKIAGKVEMEWVGTK